MDGANRADLCLERRPGVGAAGQQPVGEHWTGSWRSEVSGLCVVYIHRYVQQRCEGPGGVEPVFGHTGPSQAELLQLLQQVALLLHLLSTVELKASPVI